MSIKFNCPHCQKSLKVNQELAGKKARCAGCKRILTIPTLEPPAASADVESLAAAALGEQPPAPETAPGRQGAPIKFVCFYCDEEVEVSADLAGKQTPCPECRRIVKVPLVVADKPKDWRKVEPRGPAAGLRRDQPAAPEGAWGTATSSSTVSQAALEEADVIPTAEERLSPAQWVVRGMLATAVLGLLVAGVWTLMHLRGQNLQHKAITKALSYVAEGEKTPLTNLAAAQVHRAAGEYYLRAGKVGQAREQCKQAHGRLQRELAAPKSANERDTLAIDLALTQIELGGSQEEVDKGVRIAWKDAYTDVRRTLQGFVSLEARTEALQRVGRQLIRKGQANLAESLAAVFGGNSRDLPEMLGLVGLELIQEGQPGPAGTLAASALQAVKAETGRRLPAPALVALLVALGQEKQAEESLGVAPPRPDAKSPEYEVRLGYALGWACLGKWDEARNLAGLTATQGPALERVYALVAVAGVAAAKNSDEARRCLESALGVVEKELQGKSGDPWVLYRLVEQASRTGLAERVKVIAGNPVLIPDAGLRYRAQVEVLRGQLAAVPEGNEARLTEEISQETPHPLRVELLARHNANHGNSAAVLKLIDAWDKENLRPFGYAGVALGMQDGTR
jgi:hypothetical protein